MAETLQPISLEEIKESVARGEVSKWNVDPTTGEMLAEGFTTDSLGNVIWVGEGSEPDIKFAKDARLYQKLLNQLQLIHYKKYLIMFLIKNIMMVIMKSLKLTIQQKKDKVFYMMF